MWSGAFAAMALAGTAGVGATVVGCSGAGEGRNVSERGIGKQSSELTATFSSGPVTVNVPEYFIDPTLPLTNDPSSQNTYALRIGANYHPVINCPQSTLLAAVDQRSPPQLVAQAVAEGHDGEVRRARLSCADGDFGELAPDTTPYYIDAQQTVYLPTGTVAGEYYSFGMNDICVSAIAQTLFKLNSRLSDYDFMRVDGAPTDMNNQIKLGCGQTVGNAKNNIYLDYDPSGTLSNGNGDPSVPEAWFAVFESIDSQGRSTYVPVYRVNGRAVVLPNGYLSPELVALATWIGITLTPDMISGVAPIPVLTTFGAQTAKVGVRFWDLCMSSALGGDGGATSCPYQDLIYPDPNASADAAAGDAGDAGAVAVAKPHYREALELEGTFYEELTDPKRTTFSPFFPAFTGCEGALEDVFGVTRDTTPGDARAWVEATKNTILRNAVNSDARFQCPAQATSCQLTLGAQGAKEYMSLATLNNQISASAVACPHKIDALEITLNGDVEVALAPQAYVSFDRFRSVTIESGTPDRRSILFRERCDGMNPCQSTSFMRTRPIITMPPSSPTRNLMLNNVLMDYVAEDDADAGAGFFNLNVQLIAAKGATTGHTRISLIDSAIGTDANTSQKFLGQAINANLGDVFVVRSAVGGSTSATNPSKTVQLADSLLVLAGTTKGVGAANTVSSLTGGAGSLRYTEGHNEILGINAAIQGPIFAAGTSEAILIDTTLQRAPGKELLHFVGADTTGAPTLYELNLQRKSVVTNLQHTVMPLIMFESSFAPTVAFSGSVKLYDSPDTTGTPVPPAFLNPPTKPCTGNGNFSELALLTGSHVCSAH